MLKNKRLINTLILLCILGNIGLLTYQYARYQAEERLYLINVNELNTELLNKRTVLTNKETELVTLLNELLTLNGKLDLYKNYETTIADYTKELKLVKEDLAPLFNIELCKPKANYDQTHVNMLEREQEQSEILIGLLPIPLIDTVVSSIGAIYNADIYTVITDTNTFVAGYLGDDIIQVSATIKILQHKVNELDTLLNTKDVPVEQQLINLATVQNLVGENTLADYVYGEEYQSLGYLLYTLDIKYPLVVSLYESLLANDNSKVYYLNDITTNIMNLAQVIHNQKWDTSIKELTYADSSITKPILDYHMEMLDKLIHFNAPSLNLTKRDIKISAGLFKKNKITAYIKDVGQSMEYVVKLIDYGDQSKEPVEIYYNTQQPFIVKTNYDSNCIYMPVTGNYMKQSMDTLGLSGLDYITRAQNIAQIALQIRSTEEYKASSVYLFK